MGGWLVKYTDLVEKKLGNSGKGQYSMDELDHAIGITYSQENQDEKNILMGIAKFGNITVKQIMRSRLDVNGIDHKTPFNDVIGRIEELHYSRLPIYKDDLDEVVGIINTKDVLPYINQPADFDWHSLMRPPYFVHEQKLIKDLLREFQAKHIHFAVVVDEFGGTSGIVTLEDVMEEIIGDIKDEFDEEESGYKKIDDKNFIFDGKTMLNDVCKLMELPVDTFDDIKGNSESLAGLVLELAGEIPQVNTVIPSGGFEFTVMEILKNRLQKVKVTIKPKAEK
jgi:gliding motility-associated protein GldE